MRERGRERRRERKRERKRECEREKERMCVRCKGWCRDMRQDKIRQDIQNTYETLDQRGSDKTQDGMREEIGTNRNMKRIVIR